MHNVSLLFFVFGVAWMAYAIKGILRRKITTYPRGVVGSTYEGKAAVLQGLVEFLIGFLFFAIGLALYLPT